jgi:tRNA A37 threonylcarbamoyladenosine modification protein TsaB
VVAVPALEALAHAAGRMPERAADRRVGVWMDALRDEVFAALYERDDEGAPWRIADGPLVDAPRAVAGRWLTYAQASALPVIGDGAVRYDRVLDEVLAGRVEVIDPPPMAPSIAHLGWQRARAGEAGLPHAIRPIYVRRPDAELARDRAAAMTPEGTA